MVLFSLWNFSILSMFLSLNSNETSDDNIYWLYKLQTQYYWISHLSLVTSFDRDRFPPQSLAIYWHSESLELILLLKSFFQLPSRLWISRFLCQSRLRLIQFRTREATQGEVQRAQRAVISGLKIWPVSPHKLNPFSPNLLIDWESMHSNPRTTTAVSTANLSWATGRTSPSSSLRH